MNLGYKSIADKLHKKRIVLFSRLRKKLLYDLILSAVNLDKSADLVKEKLFHPSVTLSENVNFLVYTVAIGALGAVDTDKSAERAFHCGMMLRVHGQQG